MGMVAWWKRRQARREPAGLRQWRRAWGAAASRARSRSAVEDLRVALDALGLPEDEIEMEREMLDGLAAMTDLAAVLERSGLPTVPTGHRVVGTEACHFSAPASMPDEPAQPAGRLLLTSRRALFAGGPAGATMAWHTISEALQTGRDIVLVGRGRALRFRCNSFTDAMTGALVARRLAEGQG